MAGRLKPCACIAFAGGLIAAGAHAQDFVDPTRPPSATAGAADQEQGGRQLQSILFSGGRKIAVIDGIAVPLGGKVGEGRIVRITETEVTLRTGDEVEVLKLYPTVEKKVAARAGGARAAGKATGAEGRGGAK